MRNNAHYLENIIIKLKIFQEDSLAGFVKVNVNLHLIGLGVSNIGHVSHSNLIGIAH